MNDKKKIAIVSNTMCVGGVEVALLELLKVFDHDRYHVTLFLRDASGPFFGRIDKQVEVRFWSHRNDRDTLIGQLRQGHLVQLHRAISSRMWARLTISDWARNAFFSTRALSILDTKTYDCVIAYHGATPEVLATALYRLKSPRKIAWIHGRDSFPSGNESFWRKTYARFHHIAYVSQSIRSVFTERYPIPSCKSTVVYNILDVQHVRSSAQEAPTPSPVHPAIVTVGRLSHVKGQSMIPAATKIILDAGHDIHWYLVGDGDLRTTIEKEIRQHGVAGRVVLLGAKENPYPYIQACDIYVQPSFSEGYCTTTVEAKILHKPIVTTDAPGMREQFVSGQNGLIVEDMTPESLAEGIMFLLNAPDLRHRFQQNLENQDIDNSKNMKILYHLIES